MPQPQMTFTHDMALKDRWAVQTQSGAWTQIAPIPPPKPPMYSMRGRPSSASSVSRLVRQPAIIPQHPPPRTQNTSQGRLLQLIMKRKNEKKKYCFFFEKTFCDFLEKQESIKTELQLLNRKNFKNL